MSATDWSAIPPDPKYMLRALELAERGRGSVEPNPLVGCVVVASNGRIVGEGWHRRFGGPHAEVEALQAAGTAARGARLYVTLEPCCHHGKTPPCTEAVLRAGIDSVVAAVEDPFPAVAGSGLQQLSAAGLEIVAGLLADKSRELNAPYWKLTKHGRPWVLAKWAMTLDGKTASRSGDSRWISSSGSRAIVHKLRGRMDAIIVGRGTALADDPLLTARPPGPRVPARIVLDAQAVLPLTSQLVQTIDQAPVIIATAREADPRHVQLLAAEGCEILPLEGASWNDRLPLLLDELGRRRMTNVMVEGGATTLGGFWDLRSIDEVHVFIAPKLLGGAAAPSPLAGLGRESLREAAQLKRLQTEIVEHDLYLRGWID